MTATPARCSPAKTFPMRTSRRCRSASSKPIEDLEIDAHRGDQPLYPIVFSVE